MELSHVIGFFQEWGLIISAASAVMLLASFLVASYVVARIPVNYFTHDEPQHIFPVGNNPINSFILKCVRNVLGVILLILGFIMLFTPGQGLLSILFGIICMDFPGKFKMERRIISNNMIFAAVNRLRENRGKPPLDAPNIETVT